MAPSKTFNLPGLGCSFAIISNPQLRAAFKKAKAGIVPAPAAIGYTAALAAYRDSDGWLKALLEYLRANADLAYERISRMPGLWTHPAEATYLLWIDTRELGHGGDKHVGEISRDKWHVDAAHVAAVRGQHGRHLAALRGDPRVLLGRPMVVRGPARLRDLRRLVRGGLPANRRYGCAVDAGWVCSWGYEHGYCMTLYSMG